MSYWSEHIHIVQMRFSEHVSMAEFELWLSQMERFFLKKQPFAVVMQTEVYTDFPENYRQVQASWYKKNKSYFYQYCLGLARIAQNEADLIRLNTPALHAAWRVPYFVTIDQQEALQWAVQRWICKI